MSTSEVGGTGPSLAPHRGALILIMGILGWMVCPIFGIVSWVMGNTDLNEMRAGRMDRSGEGLTQIGKIIGMISVLLNLIIIVIVVLLFALGGGMFFMAAGAPERGNIAPEIRIENQKPQMPKAPDNR